MFEARYPIIVILDSHVEVTPGWVGSLTFGPWSSSTKLHYKGFIWDIPILIFAYVLFWGLI